MADAYLPRYLLHPSPLVENASSSALNDRSNHPLTADNDDDAAEAQTSTALPDSRETKRHKSNKKDKDRTGQNKSRSFPVVRESGPKICRAWETAGICSRDGCRFAHDWSGYFGVKPHDIHLEARSAIKGEAPFVMKKKRVISGEDELGRTVDLGTDCPVFRDMGWCPYGWRCRFLGGHVRLVGQVDIGVARIGGAERIGDWELVGKKGEDSGKSRNRETNWPDHEAISRLRNNSVREDKITASVFG